MNYPADTVFINGQVITVNRTNDTAEALAVKGDAVVFVGTNADARSFMKGAEVVDLKGRSLIPGFTDAHEHIPVRGGNELGVDCRSPGVKSIEDIKARIAERAKVTPKGGWIRGWGYDQSKLAEGRHPDRFDLDEAAPDHKVLIVRVCCHIAAFNTNALRYAGAADDGLKELAGGPVGQRNGVNNGVMFENACMEVLSTARPSLEEMVDALAVVGGMFLKEGITCCHDAGGHGAPSMKAFQKAVELDRIKTRIITMLFALVGDSTEFSNLYINSGIYTGFGNDRLKLGPIKIMIDGSSSGPTAATVEEYTSAPGNHGLLSLSQEYIDDIVLRAHTAGYQMTTHAVGDKAVIMYLDAVEKALKAHPRQDHRHRIEHCAMVGHNPDIIRRIKHLGVIPAAQPIFLYEFGDGYIRNFGEKRGGGMFPCASLLRAGIPVAGSSDCPVTFSNPLLNIHTAVNRTTQTGRLIGPDERISVADALRMFTYNAAYVSFDEKKRGSLEAGKFADLVVLSEPLLSISPEKIKDVVVDMTFIDGRKLYDRQA
jgi:predicted amidohydrolase YtcJ